MTKRHRPRRDWEGLEARRRCPVRLFEAGEHTQAEIARKLGAGRTSVHRWYGAWKRRGVAGLRKAGRAGRKPLLDAEQLRDLDQAAGCETSDRG